MIVSLPVEEYQSIDMLFITVLESCDFYKYFFNTIYIELGERSFALQNNGKRKSKKDRNKFRKTEYSNYCRLSS